MKHKTWHHKEMFPKFKYSCSKCPYATNIATDMKRHTLVHDVSRPYECTTCGNRFIALNSLSRHILIHDGEQIPGMFVHRNFS